MWLVLLVCVRRSIDSCVCTVLGRVVIVVGMTLDSICVFRSLLTISRCSGFVVGGVQGVFVWLSIVRCIGPLARMVAMLFGSPAG